jgi:hypothetical protein
MFKKIIAEKFPKPQEEKGADSLQSIRHDQSRTSSRRIIVFKN